MFGAERILWNAPAFLAPQLRSVFQRALFVHCCRVEQVPTSPPPNAVVEEEVEDAAIESHTPVRGSEERPDRSQRASLGGLGDSIFHDIGPGSASYARCARCTVHDK